MGGTTCKAVAAALLSASALTLGSEAQTEARAFEADTPIVSMAYAPAGVLFLAHGDSVSAVTIGGHEVWRRNVPARVVAPSGPAILAYEHTDDGGRLTRIGLGHGGSTILAYETSEPSPISPTTLQRSGFAALGPVDVAGAEIRSENGVFRTDEPITALTAIDADLGEGLANGALAVAGESGQVRFYPLDQVRAALKL